MAGDADLTLLEIMRRFSTEEAARAYFERIRWPNGPVCPHCGSAEKNYALTPNKKARIRPGLYKCGTCDDRFSVTVGTVMESSHIPLNKWLIAFYIMCASKTQVSALQLQRQLEIGSYRSALFLCHRIRFALKDISPAGQLGGEVEADETYIGGKAKGKGRGYFPLPHTVELLDRIDDYLARAAAVEDQMLENAEDALDSHRARTRIAELKTGKIKMVSGADLEARLAALGGE